MCRMNALSLLLPDNSVECAVANSMLHLISAPEKVVREIHRVLTPGGCFLCADDRPGLEKTQDASADNTLFTEAANGIYGVYWKLLNEQGVYPKKYSWRFDRDAVCSPLFRSKEEILLPVREEVCNKLSDAFLPRFLGKGFSDQTAVPDDLHRAAALQAIGIVRRQIGDGFDDLSFRDTVPDIALTVYKK